MSATATLNGKPQQRKQLTDQLDRLDSIIDLLADGLPGAVADACRDGARAAVRDAVIEIITNPELRAMLAPQSIPAPMPMPAAPPSASPGPARPSMWSRLKSKVNAAKAAIIGAAANIKNAVVSRCHAVRDAVAAVGRTGGEAVPVLRMTMVALGVGVAVGVACLLVPEEVAAAVGGLGAAGTAVAVQVGCWLKRAATRFGLLG